MGFVKSTAAYVGRNANKAWTFMHSTPVGSSYARWMVAGAAMGGIRGLADNIVGEDRVSVLGGILHGAMLGGAARGAMHLWSARGSLASRLSRYGGSSARSAMRARGGYGLRRTQSISARARRRPGWVGDLGNDYY
jgi:hypothetical protein